MSATEGSEKASAYLQKLCLEIAGRQGGSQGNRAATDFFASAMESSGFETEMPVFECIDWSHDGVHVSIGGSSFQAYASPYSLGCYVTAPLMIASTVEALAAVQAANRILLLYGDIAKQQLMPKNFPFYNPDEHKRIIELLEAKKPAAIIAATSRDLEMVGSLYPFPLIEDGDFDIPSVYMTEEEGLRLVEHEGNEVSIESSAKRITTQGCNVIARKGNNLNRRIVLSKSQDRAFRAH